MGLKVKRNGVWATPTSGALRIKANGRWNTVTSATYNSVVNSAKTWVNSGYTAPSGVPTDFQATDVGNGDNKTVAFSWVSPISGPTVTGYRFRVYDANNAVLTTTDLSVTTLTRSIAFDTFTSVYYDPVYNFYYQVPVTAGTIFYVSVSALSATGESTSNPKLKVTIGAASYYTDNYAFSSNTTWSTPSTAEAQGGDLQSNSASDAVDGSFTTKWVSKAHTYPNTTTEWETFSVEDKYLTAGSSTSVDYQPPRRLVGLRLRTSHRGKVWLGRRINTEVFRARTDAYGYYYWSLYSTSTAYAGSVSIPDSVAGTPSAVSTFIKEGPFVGNYASLTPAGDGWIYLLFSDFGYSSDECGFVAQKHYRLLKTTSRSYSGPLYVTTRWSDYKIVFDKPFNTTPEHLSYQKGDKPYGVTIDEIQFGYKAYESLPPTFNPAQPNVVTSA